MNTVLVILCFCSKTCKQHDENQSKRGLDLVKTGGVELSWTSSLKQSKRTLVYILFLEQLRFGGVKAVLVPSPLTVNLGMFLSYFA